MTFCSSSALEFLPELLMTSLRFCCRVFIDSPVPIQFRFQWQDFLPNFPEPNRTSAYLDHPVTEEKRENSCPAMAESLPLTRWARPGGGV